MILPAGGRWGFGGWQEERSPASCLHYRYAITLTLAAQECRRLGRPRPSQSVDLWRFIFPNQWHDDGFKKFKKRFRIENKDSETILREFTRPMKDKGQRSPFFCVPLEFVQFSQDILDILKPRSHSVADSVWLHKLLQNASLYSCFHLALTCQLSEKNKEIHC